MLTNQLAPGSVSGYPPEARELAIQQIALLRRLPLAFLPLLRERLSTTGNSLERAELQRQFTYLGALTAGPFQTAMSAFLQLKLTRELEQTDCELAGHLFGAASAHLGLRIRSILSVPRRLTTFRKFRRRHLTCALPTHRMGIAVIGQGVARNDGYRLFRKLRPQGVYFTQVKSTGGVRVLLDAAVTRAKAHPVPYGHWYIDGGVNLAVPEHITRISYNALSAPRATVQNRMRKTYEAAVFDPEAFRTMLAQMKPEDAGFRAGGDEVLNRFQLSLLTEGSGTQVFSTTFVQWTAREALRRAQPLTMVAASRRASARNK